MAWIILFIAGLVEVAWVVGLKQAAGFSRLGPTVFAASALVTSCVLLGLAARVLPIGVAYAVWTGIGSAGAVLVGVLIFKEPATPAKLACVALILAGVVGLKLTASSG
jgi:quaternary ammonium compound-resistance protein SugE